MEDIANEMVNDNSGLVPKVEGDDWVQGHYNTGSNPKSIETGKQSELDPVRIETC
jgi:hypothetical protein